MPGVPGTLAATRRRERPGSSGSRPPGAGYSRRRRRPRPAGARQDPRHRSGRAGGRAAPGTSGSGGRWWAGRARPHPPGDEPAAAGVRTGRPGAARPVVRWCRAPCPAGSTSGRRRAALGPDRPGARAGRGAGRRCCAGSASSCYSRNLDNQVGRTDPFSQITGGRPPIGWSRARMNILLLGSDSRDPDEKANAGSRTDTIILMHVQADHKHAYLISIPRDTYAARSRGTTATRSTRRSPTAACRWSSRPSRASPTSTSTTWR